METSWETLCAVLASAAVRAGALASDADDFAQEAICKLLTSYPSKIWRQANHDVPSGRAYGLGRTICTNAVKDSMRRRRAVFGHDLDKLAWDSETCITDRCLDSVLIDIESLTLTSLHKDVVTLRVTGRKVSEIASQLNVSVGTVKSILSRTRRKARSQSV